MCSKIYELLNSSNLWLQLYKGFWEAQLVTESLKNLDLHNTNRAEVVLDLRPVFLCIEPYEKDGYK